MGWVVVVVERRRIEGAWCVRGWRAVVGPAGLLLRSMWWVGWMVWLEGTSWSCEGLVLV